MRRAFAVLLASALAAAPPRAARGGEPPGPPLPDLSAGPPRERDPLLLMLASEPDLRARAASANDLIDGGASLVVLGALALPIGFVLWNADTWAAGANQRDGEPLKVSPAGPLVMLGGTIAIVGGGVMVHVGLHRREDAVRELGERHAGAARP